MAKTLRVVSPKLQPSLPPRKLYNRRVAAHVLSTSVSTIRRLEAEGKLTAVKLRAAGGVTHYLAEQVDRLAQLSSDGEVV